MVLWHYGCMMFYRRRLPHVYRTRHAVFLTWSLYGSLPSGRHFSGGPLDSGAVFAALDHLLDEARSGPVYMKQPSIADLVVDAIDYNSTAMGHYVWHAFAVMSNHVHLLVTPKVPLPKLTQSLKGITAKRANVILGRTGEPFWQEETFDRNVRNQDEFERIRFYVENNPVRAGLVREAREYRWSSAAWAPRGAPPDPGV
ncbi:MAG: transposase, partial [Bryobacteraceae bacterium]